MNMPTKREIQSLLDAEERVEVCKVVFLRSGGPAMTVRSIDKNKAICEWFDRSGRLRCHEFVVGALTGRQPLKDGKPPGLLIIGNLDPEVGGQNEH